MNSIIRRPQEVTANMRPWLRLMLDCKVSVIFYTVNKKREMHIIMRPGIGKKQLRPSFIDKMLAAGVVAWYKEDVLRVTALGEQVAGK